MDAKNYKKVARRLRVKEMQNPDLVHILINVRSNDCSPAWVNHNLKQILLNKSLDREYGIKRQVLKEFGERNCFVPRRIARGTGEKTYFHEGRFLSNHPIFGDDGLPF